MTDEIDPVEEARIEARRIADARPPSYRELSERLGRPSPLRARTKVVQAFDDVVDEVVARMVALAEAPRVEVYRGRVDPHRCPGGCRTWADFAVRWDELVARRGRPPGLRPAALDRARELASQIAWGTRELLDACRIDGLAVAVVLHAETRDGDGGDVAAVLHLHWSVVPMEKQ